MMTEFNLTSIINRLVDKKCFVISGDQLDDDGYFAIDNGRFEFNIFGYYFSLLAIGLAAYLFFSFILPPIRN